MTQFERNRTLRSAAFAVSEGLLLFMALAVSESQRAGVIDWHFAAYLALVVAVGMFLLHRIQLFVGPAIVSLAFFTIWAIQQSPMSLRDEGFAMLVLTAGVGLLMYLALAGNESVPWQWANRRFGKTMIIEVGDGATTVTDTSGVLLFRVTNEMIVQGHGRRTRVLGVGVTDEELHARGCDVSDARRIVLTSAGETERDQRNLWQAFLLYCHARSQRGSSILSMLFTNTHVVVSVSDRHSREAISEAVRKARIFEHGVPNQRMHTTRGGTARV